MPLTPARRDLGISLGLTSLWCALVLGGLLHESSALLILAFLVGLSASIQIGTRKGHPAWLGVFAALILLGPLLMWAVPPVRRSPLP